MFQEEEKALEDCRLLAMVGRQAGRHGRRASCFCFVRLLYLDLDILMDMRRVVVYW